MLLPSLFRPRGTWTQAPAPILRKPMENAKKAVMTSGSVCVHAMRSAAGKPKAFFGNAAKA